MPAVASAADHFLVNNTASIVLVVCMLHNINGHFIIFTRQRDNRQHHTMGTFEFRRIIGEDCMHKVWYLASRVIAGDCGPNMVPIVMHNLKNNSYLFFRSLCCEMRLL